MKKKDIKENAPKWATHYREHKTHIEYLKRNKVKMPWYDYLICRFLDGVKPL